MNQEIEKEILSRITAFQDYCLTERCQNDYASVLFELYNIWKSNPQEYNEIILEIIDKTIEEAKL